MPTAESLDVLIARKAGEFAVQVRKQAGFASKEEEIRIAVEKQLAFIQKEAGIELEGKHEFTLAKGRVDSVYSRVLIEYKNPSSAAKIGPKLDSPGTKAVVEQIKSRFRDLKNEQNQPHESLFGVGTDGLHFVFVRFRDKKWDIQEPVEVNKYSVERFLWALFNLGRKGKPFQPEYLAADFGAGQNSIALPGVHALYDAIVETKNPKAQTFFNQWKILFGEVCGYDVENPSDKMKKLAESYSIPLRGFKPAELLFALHSYYALFMKLLAAQIVTFTSPLIKSPIRKLLAAPTSNKLKSDLEELERGDIFPKLGITNFLEGDLFAWYTSVWSEPIIDLVRKMVNKLDDYNPGTLSEDPVNSRDLLKKLYQQLFPKSVRHDLGEYYTPDWLAEHVLNEVGYEGDPDKRVLDPACGSGTFLVMTINRIKRWFEENREHLKYDDADLAKKILNNVVGFDLNPLAVMAARTNYLIALGDLAHRAGTVEIPIYLCDSIMTPSEYGGLFAGGVGGSRKFKTAATTFIVPTEIARSRDDVAKYAEQLEFGVRNGYKPDEFLKRCQDEGLTVTEKSLHNELYEDLVRLDKENRNGVWARIIKNAFAPVFLGKVDYVVGNPPWVNWESLPKEYRDSTIHIWDKYRLRERATRGSRLGNVKRELSVLFVYVAFDHYLTKKGMLGFVITQSIFKSGANEGFRRFSVADKRPFKVKRVVDQSLFLPFENAVNRTAILVGQNGKQTDYPVPYKLWVPAVPRGTVLEAPLEDVLEQFDVSDWRAAPVEPSVPQSTWLTAPKDILPILQKVVGDRSSRIMDRTYAGSCTWMNGVFWVESKLTGSTQSLIQNLGDVGRNKVETVVAQVDGEFLFPLLRGRDVRAWAAKPSAMILVPHRNDDFGEPVALATMKQRYPKTFAYFRGFEAQLKSRSGYKQLHHSRPEFYVVGNVGNYALSPYKVVFKDLTEFFQCAVVGPQRVIGVSKPAPVIPDHTLLFITSDVDSEAYFISGVLNSIPARVGLYCASVGVQTQRYFPTDVSRVRLPDFNSSDGVHREIVELSKKCHASAAQRTTSAVSADDVALSRACAGLWGITEPEFGKLIAAYQEMQGFRTRRVATEADEPDGEDE